MAIPTRVNEESVRDYLNWGLWDKTSLSEHWDRNASLNPEGAAVSDGHRSLSWSECKLWTDRLALAMIHAGLLRDEVLLVQLPNCAELPLVRLACEKAGILSLPVPRTLRHNEIESCLRHAGATALVIPLQYRGFNYVAMANELQRELPQLRHIFVTGKIERPPGTFSVEEICRDPWEKKGPCELTSRRFRSDEVSLINATTGSSGAPKFAEYTAAARLLYGRSYVEVFGLTEKDVFAALSPAAGGPNIPVYFAAPQLGAKSVFLEQFEAEAAFKLIENESVSVACLGPAQLSMMVRHPHCDKYDLSSVRFWLSVGAPLSSNLAREVEAKLGAMVLNTYGAVDWGGVVFTSPEDPPEVRYTTVGKPRHGTEVRLVKESGEPAGCGEIGEVQGRGPPCSSGYFRDIAATRKAWTTDGWLRLGDLGQWDEKGNLMLLGRKDEMIIRGGQNIQPSEIESHLLAHPRIRQAAVVGMPDMILGERVCAYVVPQTNQAVTLADIVLFLRARKIAAFKFPERLEVVESLPMVSDTKINKRLLKADVAEKLRREA
ncbi:MAG: AMP-binding protein [Deltaproteobacteria bacterium]|nr:AMP-binding protein [Deltaproteobacteria bacterium]